MNDELIKRLRKVSEVEFLGLFVRQLLGDASAALEAANARIAELATDLERTRHQRNAAHVEARREIDKEYRDRIAALESAGKAEPIYQERTVNGFWQDVSKELHDSISAGRVRSEGVRIVYTAPAALAQPLEAQADARWQPIETAPKDGTEVLLIATLYSMLMPYPERIVGAYRNGWWSGPATLSHVTHWQPLPAAPAALSQKAGEQQ